MKKEEPEFEEFVVECVCCGKKVKVIRRRGFSLDNFICQKCGMGEIVEMGEE